MLFINTRPIDRAQPLTECLRQSGFDVVDLPLLELTPRPYNNILQQLYLQLLSTQIIVVVSPTAVQVGMQYLQQSGLSLFYRSNIFSGLLWAKKLRNDFQTTV